MILPGSRAVRPTGRRWPTPGCGDAIPHSGLCAASGAVRSVPDDPVRRRPGADGEGGAVDGPHVRDRWDATAALAGPGKHSQAITDPCLRVQPGGADAVDHRNRYAPHAARTKPAAGCRSDARLAFAVEAPRSGLLHAIGDLLGLQRGNRRELVSRNRCKALEHDSVPSTDSVDDRTTKTTGC